MGEKLPQSTETLIKRLRRVAKHLDRMLDEAWAGTSDAPQWKARANTCWQAAARLEEFRARLKGEPPTLEVLEADGNRAHTADPKG